MKKFFFSMFEYCHAYSTFRFISFEWRYTFFSFKNVFYFTFIKSFWNWINVCLHSYFLKIFICPQLINFQQQTHINSSLGDVKTNSFSLSRSEKLIQRFFALLLATLVEGDPMPHLSIATTPMCWGGRYSFPWIAPLYPWSLPYNAEC